MMKLLKRILILSAAAAVCLLTSCSGQPDAGVLVREARANASAMKSCSASVGSTLIFTANDNRHNFQSSGTLDYNADPFAVKSVQSSNNDGSSGNSETYTVTENGGLSFYGKTASGWQKTGAENLDTSPAAQIDILRLLNNVDDQKYVRETEIGTQKVHKVELKLKGEVLRSMIENIVTASGMGGNSKTIVQTLLDSAPAIYGYCDIGVDSGKLVRLDLDATDAVNQIFQNIDGSTVKIEVTKCVISGNLSKIDSTPAVVVPQAAKSASSVQAKG